MTNSNESISRLNHNMSILEWQRTAQSGPAYKAQHSEPAAGSSLPEAQTSPSGSATSTSNSSDSYNTITTTDAHSFESSPNDDDSPSHKDIKPLPKQKQKRNGKIVGVLRQQYKTSGALQGPIIVNLAPSATRTKLASIELKVALSYHLLQQASGKISAPSSPPLVDIDHIWKRAMDKVKKAAVVDDMHEILIACLQALGSRRSTHSSITGLATASAPTSSLYRSPSSSSSSSSSSSPSTRSETVGPSVVVSLSESSSADHQLGPRREMACRTLVQRAVDFAEDLRLLDDTSPEALETACVLRVTLFATRPRHPFLATLNDHLRKAYKAAPTPTSQEQLLHFSPPCDDLGVSLALADAIHAVMIGQPLKISNAELVVLYGWTPSKAQSATKEILFHAERGTSSPAQREAAHNLYLTILRDVSRLQQTKICSTQVALNKLKSLLKTIHHLLDTQEISTSSMFYGKEVAPHLGTICLLAETVATKECKRLCSAMLKESKTAKEIVDKACLRFCRWLKRTVLLMWAPQFATGAERNHCRAVLLSTLDLLPDWVDLAIAAAGDAAIGGPLSEAGLSWDDLFRLKRALKLSSAVFARSSAQEARLGEALAALDLKDPADGKTEDPAEWMVQSALVRIGHMG
ncbi:hypothetical protein T439DRAFT_348511 [Meredithblackwellia eburnea MCA 4105]